MAKGGGEGGAHGAELVSGYISLSVKYSSAMQQIGHDLTAIDVAAKETGHRAGKSLETGLSAGASKGARTGRIAALREWSQAEVEAKTSSERIGNVIGKAMAAPIVLPIKAARAGIHGLGAAAGATSKEVEKLGEKGKDSIAEIVPMGGALTGALGGVASKLGPIGIALIAATGAFGGLLEVGEKWEDLGHKFSFSTGLKGEDLEKMKDMVAEIGTEIPSSFGTIADSVAEVTKNIGLSGEALKTVSAQVTVLREHGQDVDVEALGKTKRAMGTKDEEVPALLDQLYAANQKTGVSVNALLGGLATGGAVFKQFGLNIGESAALMTQFDEAGLDVSKVAPDMTRAFKDAAKAGEKFPDFLKENIEQLKKFKDAGNDVAANQLAVKLFGPKQAAQVMGLIASGKLDLDDLGRSAALDSAGPGILPTARENEGVGDKWKMLGNSFDVALKPTGDKLAGTLAHWMDNLDKFRHSDTREHIRQNLTHAGSNVGHAFGNVGHAFENIGHAAMNVWHALTNVWHACENAWHAITNVWHACENVWHALMNVGNAVGKTLEFLISLPGALGTFLEGLPVAIGHFLAEAADTIGSVFGTVGDKVGGFFSTAADKVASFFSTAVDKIVGFFSDLPDKIGKIISDAFSGVGSTISNLFSGIHIPGFAGGGAMSAPGPNGRDSALFWGANNEHVLTSDDVNAAGGHAGVYAWRAALHRDDGGPIGPDVGVARAMRGTPYSQGARNDCSGMVGRVVEGATHTGGPLPTTKNMGAWLKSHGFKSGSGGPGSIRVGWYDNGGGPNSGHTAMTLSDGENAESGGSNGVFTIGSGAAGADNPEFNHHMYLPASSLYGEGEGGEGGSAFGDAGGGGFGGGGIPAGATPGVGPNGEAGYFSGSADPEKVTKAKDRITSIEDEIKTLENKRDHSKKALTADEKTKVDDELVKKNHELDEAKEKLADAERGDFHKSKGGKGKSGKGDKGNPLEELGGIFDKGIGEALLPPGFTKMMDTPLAKSGGALLSFLGEMLTGHGGAAAGKALGGLGGGLKEFLPQAFGPHAVTPSAGAGGEEDAAGLTLPSPGSLPGVKNAVPDIGADGQPAELASFVSGGQGGNVTNHYGPNYAGATIGHDPAAHAQAVSNDKNATKRANVSSTQRQGFVNA